MTYVLAAQEERALLAQQEAGEALPSPKRKVRHVWLKFVNCPSKSIVFRLMSATCLLKSLKVMQKSVFAKSGKLIQVEAPMNWVPKTISGHRNDIITKSRAGHPFITAKGTRAASQYSGISAWSLDLITATV